MGSTLGLQLLVPSGCIANVDCCEVYWLETGLFPRPLYTKCLLQNCVGLDSLTLVIHSCSMHLFLHAGFMKNKLNIYKDCTEDNFEKGRTRFVMSGHQIKHASTNLPL